MKVRSANRSAASVAAVYDRRGFPDSSKRGRNRPRATKKIASLSVDTIPRHIIFSFLLEGQLWCGGEFDCAVGFVKGDDSALEWAIVFEGNADLLAADEGGGLDGFG